MSSRTRSRRPASIGSNQSSRRWTAVPASDCRARDFVLLLLMAWSPPARKRRHRLGFNHPETTPPAIPTTPRTAPVDGAQGDTHPAVADAREIGSSLRGTESSNPTATVVDPRIPAVLVTSFRPHIVSKPGTP